MEKPKTEGVPEPVFTFQESEPTTDDILKEVVKNEVALKIRENFKQRKEIGVQPELVEFEYLRNYLLLGKILDHVTERGILGTQKKNWKPILGEIEDYMDQLSPESREAVEKSMEDMYGAKRELDRFIKETAPDEVFSEIVGDGEKHQLKGSIYIKTLGDILTVHLPDKDDFSKVYSRFGTLSEDETNRTERIGGFARKQFLKTIGREEDMIVFPGQPTATYRSTLAHEVSHRISERLFDPDFTPLDEAHKEEFKKPEEALDEVYDYWINNRLKDELWNQALSGLMHFDNAKVYGSKIEKILDRHVDYITEKGKNAIYDWPEEDGEEFIKKTKKLFPEENEARIRGMYAQRAEKYYEFAAKNTEFLKSHLASLPAGNMRYDFLNLLRFEKIEKWPRIPRFLEKIGKNSDKLAEILESKYGKQRPKESEQPDNDIAKALALLRWTNSVALKNGQTTGK